ncbi:MAG: DUF2306 domain-containing protein [Gemmatimonadales bacterium]|nr:DUF2306 domain-containing protein [Gemmatimonadales bacterium]
MPMTLLASSHLLLGVVALATGGAVVLLPKGTPTHRVIGRAYAAAMVALCLLSFGLRGSSPFFAGYGPFHVMAVVSLVTLAFGLREVWRRARRDWMAYHLAWMLWSYVGLVMATGSHLVGPLVRALRGPLGSGGAAMAVTALLVWALPMLAGRRLIPRAVERATAAAA